jgi:peptidoglycan/LPS O-acetylase OafA/YrhL
MNYIKKIDAIRAIAVLMVVMSHWVPKTSKFIPFGEIGVDIFFVISGFLITRILITEKAKAIQQDKGLTTVLKNFISRRALRIFPIYYLSLFIFWLLQDYEGYHIREDMIYYVTYTSNILFFARNAWDGYLAPLWSLAVEEQFYLVWPLLIVLIPQKHTLKIILISMIIGLMFPFFFEKDMVKVLTPSCMNALGSGALLAWLSVMRPDLLKRYRMGFLGLACASLMLTFIIWAIAPFNAENGQFRMMVSIFSFVVLIYCIGIYSPIRSVEWIVNNSALIFIGQISYGIYLYHNIISIVWRNFMVGHFQEIYVNIGASYANGISLIIKFALLIMVSWASYQFVEKPILNFKKYFVLD